MKLLNRIDSEDKDGQRLQIRPIKVRNKGAIHLEKEIKGLYLVEDLSEPIKGIEVGSVVFLDNNTTVLVEGKRVCDIEQVACILEGAVVVDDTLVQ